MLFNKIKTHSEAIIAIATIVIAFATIINLGITIFMWNVTQTSLDLSLTNFFIENSPYLYVDGIKYDKVNVNDTLTFTLKIKNYGKSAAFLAEISEIRIYDKKLIDIDSTTIKNLPLISTGGKTISVDSTEEFCTKSNLVYNDNQLIYKEIFIIGRIMYKDIFNRTLYTRFAGLFKDNIFLPKGNLNKVGIEVEPD